MKRIQIITGHYGSGKTEYAVNLALHLVQEHENVALADMDIVNPYFRSYEQAKRLGEAGIRVIVTSCGGIADIPAINPEVMSIFQQEKWTGVLDIGGDPIGARVLARFAPQLKPEEFDLLFVLNANRPETKDVESALAYMQGIEAECRQKVTGIVNNTHLCGETTAEEILKGAKLAHALSERTSLPVIHHAVQRKFVEQVQAELPEPVLPMNIYMKKPWEIIFCEEE
jgi:Mrp family chromosome partitioning ATPase